ncbi:SDR family NAD(P)-dependent oxidoreductase [Salisediminibacterium halotolerans]|uniref:SDR family NAD(P)-dependent oxidoreductase n=1 Tax=Salisediminibacterium halotolerans TaxID=517425 RepID=UPI000EB43F25|nr:SDR family oxidoreductase [Salisediminibacterium halotolerans]RLJ78264.1 NAD(P)-dependent dehydrogenase (short-subunit alcohol dehydrogenase family) [Actinophytocola xinjiangensis]RPE88397.1 NAD(P)-dependent dehydrogenase (short-subunit alcohol dehydrogenase family) [Salisediminibacterium halotolerans]TWG37241.1 NAD(P)-dependent dehydrogenase (short-subunit alcohol dehydrogenase family) [Salisediminibacterium halotolerans]GEL07721.1 putative oxidoreductase YvrD [Salisediminibacterium halotol
MDMELEGKRILITGAARGIGKKTAELFLREGAEVMINGRDRDQVASAVNELAATGACYGVTADVSHADGIAELVKEVEKIGEPDVVINNAGLFGLDEFFTADDNDWQNYLDTNLFSCVRLMRRFLPGMLARNTGRIINVASEAGMKPDPTMIPYSVTKSAVISLTRGAAELTKGTNVTVNSVMPGPTRSEGVEAFICEAAEERGLSRKEFLQAHFHTEEPTSLLERFAEPEEIAFAIVFLASPRASAVNGTCQRADGGIYQSI